MFGMKEKQRGSKKGGGVLGRQKPTDALTRSLSGRVDFSPDHSTTWVNASHLLASVTSTSSICLFKSRDAVRPTSHKSVHHSTQNSYPQHFFKVKE